MPISIELLRSVQRSAAAQREEAAKLKELLVKQQQHHRLQNDVEVKKKKLSDQEQELMVEYKSLHLEHKKAQQLLNEGNQRLENSLKKRDFADVQAAYALNKSGTEPKR